jgi:hypothetical protein
MAHIALHREENIFDSLNFSSYAEILGRRLGCRKKGPDL